MVSFSLLLISGIVYAYSSGITGRTMRGPDPGCTCHGSNPTASVIVQIMSLDSVETSDSVLCLLTIAGGPLTRAGTDIAVQRGTVEPINAMLQKMTGELTHVSPLTPMGSIVTVPFMYMSTFYSGTLIQSTLTATALISTVQPAATSGTTLQTKLLLSFLLLE